MNLFPDSKMKKFFLIALFFFIIFLTWWSGILSDQDTRDQKAMRKLFSIPKEYVMEEYRGNTGGSGTMQRENLGLSVRYKLLPDQSKSIETRIQNELWEALPITDQDILVHLNLGQDLLNDFAEKKGFYRCRTIGDFVLFWFN